VPLEIEEKLRVQNEALQREQIKKLKLDNKLKNEKIIFMSDLARKLKGN